MELFGYLRMIEEALPSTSYSITFLPLPVFPPGLVDPSR